MIIKRIGALSCARILGALYAVLGFVVGAIFSMITLAGGFASDASEAARVGAMVGAAAVVIFPILYGCIGFVATLIGASIYNALAGVLGGIELDVQ